MKRRAESLLYIKKFHRIIRHRYNNFYKEDKAMKGFVIPMLIDMANYETSFAMACPRSTKDSCGIAYRAYS